MDKRSELHTPGEGDVYPRMQGQLLFHSSALWVRFKSVFMLHSPGQEDNLELLTHSFTSPTPISLMLGLQARGLYTVRCSVFAMLALDSELPEC